MHDGNAHSGQDTSISVVIPAYNSEKFIEESVSSVMQQTQQANEIIVIDDGSTDETRSKVEQLGCNYLHYYYQENRGKSAARTLGVKKATATWIAFLDSDDYWHEEKLQRQIELLNHRPDLDWVSCNYFNEKTGAVAVDSKSKMYFPKDALKLLSQNPLYVWTSVVLVKREHVLKLGGFDPTLPTSQDTDFWIRYAYKFPQFGYCPQVLATYRDNPKSATYKNADTRIENVGKLIQKHHQFSSVGSSSRKDTLMKYAFRPVFGLLGEYPSKEIRILLNNLSEQNIRVPLLPLFLSCIPRNVVAIAKRIVALKRNLVFNFRKRVVPSRV